MTVLIAMPFDSFDTSDDSFAQLCPASSQLCSPIFGPSFSASLAMFFLVYERFGVMVCSSNQMPYNAANGV